MFNKAILLLATLSVVAAGGPPPAPPPTTISQCDTGEAQCCNSISSSSNPATATLLGLIGAVVQGVDVPIGLGCTPITVIGVGQGANCAQQPACCTGDTFKGLVTIGCSPISI